MNWTESLRIAVPKGRLLDSTLALFRGAGLEVPEEQELRSRRLRFSRGGVEWILVKDCDVPVYVEHSAADLGLAGLDQIAEHESTAISLLETSFGSCRMSVIANAGAPPVSNRSTIATKYPRISRRYIEHRHLHAEVVPLGGSVELAAVLGLTTHVIDLVQSGETIRANGLVEQEVVMEIAPRLIAGRDAYRRRREQIRALVARIEESSYAPVSS